MKKLALAAAVVMLAQVARAADLTPIYKAPPPVDATTWTGAYLGVSLGAR